MLDTMSVGKAFGQLILIFAFVRLAASAPADQSYVDPAQQSTDIWASVIANVAPLMALVGDRNAKEFMRSISTWHQLLLLSCAPLGILAILVSSIRLSGPGFLRRLVGRDFERRSEALVEVTPLSVRPATSVYTSRAVEIEATLNKSGVAFVGGHVREADAREAIDAFRNILESHIGTIDEDKDMEAILAIWSETFSLESSAALVDFAANLNGAVPAEYPAKATAAVSYRTTGISPTQRQTSFSRSWYGPRNVLVFVSGLAVLIGIQVLGMRYGDTSRQTFYMGLAGYLAIVIFTFLLLMMVKGEIVLEKLALAPCFDTAVWSFSNSAHTEHRAMERPSANTLITARPFEPNATQRFWREAATTVLTAGLVGSYVLYYISMRVSPWWVSLSSVGVIWMAALFRALFAPQTIVTSPRGLQNDEFWIGMLGRTLNESLLATIDTAHHRPLLGNNGAPSSATPSEAGDFIVVEPKTTNSDIGDAGSHTALLLIHQSMRIAMNSWSGAEDVIKVGLEIAKLACRTQANSFPSHQLCPSPNSRWLRLVRMKLMIYVPGLLWRSSHYLDMPLPKDFTLNDVVRHVLKVIHVCLDQPGTLSRHAVTEDDAIELSHVLCGPIADPPVRKDFTQTTATLRELLAAMRDNERNQTSNKYTVEQTLLMPTVMLASAYDRWLGSKSDTGGFGQRVEELQGAHPDSLALSGIKWVPTLQKELGRLRVLEEFMTEVSADTQADQGEKLTARGDDAGDYGTHNRQREDGRDVDRLELQECSWQSPGV
jgi:hypothetical protein